MFESDRSVAFDSEHDLVERSGVLFQITDQRSRTHREREVRDRDSARSVHLDDVSGQRAGTRSTSEAARVLAAGGRGGTDEQDPHAWAPSTKLESEASMRSNTRSQV